MELNEKELLVEIIMKSGKLIRVDVDKIETLAVVFSDGSDFCFEMSKDKFIKVLWERISCDDDEIYIGNNIEGHIDYEEADFSVLTIEEKRVLEEKPKNTKEIKDAINSADDENLETISRVLRDLDNLIESWAKDSMATRPVIITAISFFINSLLKACVEEKDAMYLLATSMIGGIKCVDEEKSND